ncbi:hypothetical protein GCM10025873_20900 [Demequina sediminis]|nr:hypothetical protein GCM10025873_20900 [Demequina sediminis]
MLRGERGHAHAEVIETVPMRDLTQQGHQLGRVEQAIGVRAPVMLPLGWVAAQREEVANALRKVLLDDVDELRA